MDDSNPPLAKRMALSTKLTSGLVLFSVLLMATVLAISIVTLVRVYQIEKTQEKDAKRAENPLNIPSPASANPEDPAKYKAYSNFASRLQNSMDLSKNPCDNFYEYSCGNFEGNISFTEIQIRNLLAVIGQFQKESYMNQPKLPLPVKQAGQFFAKCVQAKGKWDKEVGKGEWLEEKMKKLEDKLNVHFPLLNPNSEQGVHYPDSRTFSSALAHLNNEENLPTFVTTTVETNWQDPHSQLQPYILAFDQATLSLQEAYFIRIWDQIKGQLLENMIQTLSSYAEFKGVKLERAKIEEDAKAMLEMEYEIGAKLNTREDIRRNYKRMYHVQKAGEADRISKYLNFEELVRNSVPARMDMRRVENFLVKEPQAMAKIMDYIFSPDKVKPRTLFNYLFYRLLSANLEYLPKKVKLTKLPEATNFRLGLPRMPRRIPLPNNPPIDFDLEAMFSPEQLIMGRCALENAQLFPWANGRVYLDAKFPAKEERQKLRADIRSMIAAVLDAFRSMLSQLIWMDEMTKTAAYSKIDKLVTNAAWPELVENDELLAKYYGELEWKEAMSYTQMVDLLQKYQQHIIFKELFTARDTDRSDFSNSPSIVNAWYQPELNSITFPLGILEPPFYDPNFPASVNFGGIGLIAGHELTHGFDDQGIQWDGTGVLKNWMDQKSEKGFDNMANCVVGEYGQFEPVKGLTIDGKMTQGENIADNGGLRASFKAFRTHVGLNGPDPRLPHEQLKMFSHDQLFFLSFAQGWCQIEGERDLKKQLLIDPHSPSKYRVLGSIQNFPAFRAAFNCPLGTVYGPEKHCEVWETESELTN